MKIVDPTTGLVVPRGAPGEICTRGYSVMLGYWDEPETTAQAIDAAGWMHTGDLGDDGRRRVREHLRAHQGHGHPRRREHVPARDRGVPLHAPATWPTSQVIGVPDEKYGEELMAWVILRDGARRSPTRRCARSATGKIAHYKVPRYCKFVDEFPMTVTGKIQKFQMRESGRGESSGSARRRG